MTRYIIPFTFGKDMNAVEVCDLLKKHNINIGAQTSFVNNEYLIKGTMENLIGFLKGLGSPTIKLVMAEQIRDYIYEKQVAAFA